jgi:ribosomal protein L37E
LCRWLSPGFGLGVETTCRVYRPRDPRKTPLFGLLDSLYDRVRCRRCPEEFLVAFSCKRRGVCPSCGAKRAAELAAFLRDEVVEQVGHAQWVFTIPKRLRI